MELGAGAASHSERYAWRHLGLVLGVMDMTFTVAPQSARQALVSGIYMFLVYSIYMCIYTFLVSFRGYRSFRHSNTDYGIKRKSRCRNETMRYLAFIRRQLLSGWLA